MGFVQGVVVLNGFSRWFHFLIAFFVIFPAESSIAKNQVRISRFLVGRNTLIDSSLMQSELAPFVGEADLSRLQAAVIHLKQIYRRSGYGVVQVSLPEQTIVDGQVHLLVTEGKLGQVQVTGNRQFSAENIRNSLPALREGHTPNLIDLDFASRMIA